MRRLAASDLKSCAAKLTGPDYLQLRAVVGQIIKKPQLQQHEETLPLDQREPLDPREPLDEREPGAGSLLTKGSPLTKGSLLQGSQRRS